MSILATSPPKLIHSTHNLSNSLKNALKRSFSQWKFSKRFSEPPTIESLVELNSKDMLLKTMAKHRSIPTTDKISPSNFKNQYQSNGSPVVIQNLASHWPAASKWKNPLFFAQNFEKDRIPIDFGGTIFEPYWCQKLFPFNDFIFNYITLSNRLKVDPNTGKPMIKANMVNHRLLDQIPQLKKDIEIPSICTTNDNKLHSICATIGPVDSVIPLNQSTSDVLIVQIVGFKYVRIYHPSDSDKLYSIHSEKGKSTYSPVNIESIDIEQHPLASHLDYREYLLNPGDALYLPLGPWCFQKALSYSCTLSFNFGL